MTESYDDYERQQRVERAKELVADVQELQRQQFSQAANNAVAAGIADALKEAGLNEKDWNSVYFSDPSTTIEKQRQVAKRFAQKLIKKAGKPVRDPQGRFVQQGQGQQQGSRLDLSQVAEDRRGGKISSDAALGKMVDSTLHDYFLNGLLR